MQKLISLFIILLFYRSLTDPISHRNLISIAMGLMATLQRNPEQQGLQVWKLRMFICVTYYVFTHSITSDNDTVKVIRNSLFPFLKYFTFYLVAVSIEAWSMRLSVCKRPLITWIFFRIIKLTFKSVSFWRTWNQIDMIFNWTLTGKLL